jgi:hypothetical protein
MDYSDANRVVEALGLVNRRCDGRGVVSASVALATLARRLVDATIGTRTDVPSGAKRVLLTYAGHLFEGSEAAGSFIRLFVFQHRILRKKGT